MPLETPPAQPSEEQPRESALETEHGLQPFEIRENPDGEGFVASIPHGKMEDKEGKPLYVDFRESRFDTRQEAEEKIERIKEKE